ncbi:MAG: hypothetical protein WA688_09805 [Thermoplasmata archaeon]
MAGAARAVRIPRDGDGSSIAVEPPSSLRSPPPSTTSPGTVSRRFTNSAGSSRALRTFLFFLVALAVIFGVFMDFAVTSVVSGTNYAVEAILTVSVAVALIIGWFVTLGQAPSVAWVQNGQLVVRERTGRTRRFPTDTVRIHVLRSNDPGPFGPEPTEFVELSAPGGARRTYLVATHFFDFAR